MDTRVQWRGDDLRHELHRRSHPDAVDQGRRDENVHAELHSDLIQSLAGFQLRRNFHAAWASGAAHPMNRFSIIRRDQNGAAAIEFAIAVPILVTLIWGIFQLACLFWANAGM